MRFLRPALGVGVGALVLAAGIGTATAGDPAQPRVQLAPAAVTSPPTGQPPTSGGGTGDADAARPYMLEIDGRPAALAAQLTQRSTGSSTQAARSGRRQRATNVAAQAAAMETAERRGLVVRELYRVRSAYNGVAVMARPSDVDRLRRVPGVRSVSPIPLHERQNGHSVPATRAPQVWKAAAGGNIGRGLRVGVLDTGIDYVHTTFAGSGDADDLDAARDPANNPEASGPVPGFEVRNATGDLLFPSPVVVGGVDFVGDDYDGQGVGRPDPNPMDCPADFGGGHGTHVAGTVGGRGVNADGSTYTGGYESVPDDLRIGPGVAPGVEFYAIRVFGCVGVTAYIARGIDWAVDPDQDGDPSDHLDVLNISAGSNFGDGHAADVAAARNASRLGVAVVISAGNNGNLTNAVGSPAVTPEALTVANISSGDWLDEISVSGAADSDLDGEHHVRASGDYGWDAMAGDVSGTLVRAPADNRDGCAPYSGSLAGKVVMVEVRPEAGAPMACPSSVVAGHATDADAAGVVMADPNETYGPQMAGNEHVPLVHALAPVRTRLLAALADDATPTVTFSPTMIAHRYDPATADTVDESTSRGPAAAGGLKPEIAAPGQSIKSARSGSGNGASVMGGTSMAAPHVAGAMALLRKHRSSWTVEELKAALVNTARAEVHTQPGHGGRLESPARVGSGAMDVEAALRTTSVAYAADADGAVALGFGAHQVPVGAPYRVERTVRVVNKSLGSVTYAVGLRRVTDVPGVEWELPDGDTVTVGPAGTAELRVRMVVADPSALRNARDDTLPETFDDGDEVFRQRWLAEATALLQLTASGRSLTVPVHAAVRPAAATTTASPVELLPGATSGALRFSGPTFDSGRTSADFLATRFALEWQASSPRIPAANGKQPPASADVEHVGVTVRDDTITFGVSTWGANPAPGLSGAVNVLIDRDGDGEADLRLYEYRPAGSDAFLTCVFDGFETEDQTRCTASLLNRLTEEPGVYGSRVSLLSAPLDMLELDGPFTYQVATSHHLTDGMVDVVGPLPFDPANPALRFDVGTTVGGGAAGLEADVPGQLPFAIDRARAEATGTTGVLVLHPLGTADQQVETVAIRESAPRPVVPPEGPPVDPPRDPVPTPPPFLPHDLRLPVPPKPRLPVHRRTANVAGARLTITGPRRCVTPSGAFTVELSARRRSRNARFTRIARSELRIGGKRVSVDRKAPFRHRVRVKRLKPGSLHRVDARTSLRLRDGKLMRKTISVRFRVCG